MTPCPFFMPQHRVELFLTNSNGRVMVVGPSVASMPVPVNLRETELSLRLTLDCLRAAMPVLECPATTQNSQGKIESGCDVVPAVQRSAATTDEPAP